MKETVLQAAMRLSAVDGTAFFDAGVADILTDHIGERLYIRDSAGATIWGWIKAAGTGETLGSELIANGGFESGDPPTSWDTFTNVTLERDSVNPYAGTYSGKITSTDATLRLVSQTVSTEVGALYNYQYASRANAGETLFAQPRDGVVNFNQRAITSTSWALYSAYRTMQNITFSHWFYVNSASGFSWVDACGLKKVLTPSSTGVTIVSTEGGSTYNWASKDAGFNYNDTTYEISTELFTDIPKAQSDALQALYVDTNGDSWHDKTGWDGATAGDCYGVTVAGGVVTALDLRANNLDGEFTAAVVAALTSCTTIHVEGNPSLNVSFDLDDLPASVTDFVADYTDSNLAGGSSAMSAVDIEEISIRSASLSSLSVADIIDRIYADRGNFNHPTPILRIDNLEDETLAYIATHGVSRTPAEIAAINANIKAIKAGTPVVLSSLTAKLSMIDGTAFVTRSSVDLRPYKDFKLSFSDGAQSLVGWGKAYGEGETLGSECITGWTNIDYETLTVNGNNHDLDVAANTAGTADAFTNNCFSAGKLYKIPYTAISDGQTPRINTRTGAVLNYQIAAYGSGTVSATVYRTAATGAVGIDESIGIRNTTVMSMSFALSVKQVLAPDTTGLTIVSASGGSTYNWASDGGIDPNAASFTLTITNS